MTAGLRGALRLPAAFLLVGLLLALDVATKHWAGTDLRQRGSRVVIDKTLQLRVQENRGAAFGFLLESRNHPLTRPLLVAYSGVATGVVAVLFALRVARGPRFSHGRFGALGLGALLAGTAGNFLDRARRGAVVDFVEVILPGVGRWPAFNLADVYLAAGVLLCALGLLLALGRRDPAQA